MSAPLDGNALAGALGELFAVDVTAADTTCVGCGHRAPVAALELWVSGPGVVARCQGCTGVVLRYVRTPDSAWLDLRGTVALRIPLAGADRV